MRPETAAIDTLLETLNTERQVVEYLVFKVVTLNLLLTADERSLDRVRDRRGRPGRRAPPHGRGPPDPRARRRHVGLGGAGRRAVAGAARQEASGPSARAFRELRHAFRAATDEIERVMGENRRLADSGLRGIQTVLESVTGVESVDVYTGSGVRQRAQAPLRLDWAL